MTFLSSQAWSSAPACSSLLNSIDQKNYKLSAHHFAKYEEAKYKSKLFLDPKTVNNEKSAHFFEQVLSKSSHEALIGLGGDINLNLAAMGRHKALFIYDMDPRVIGFHQLIAAAMKKSSTPEQFIDYFSGLQKNTITETDQKAFVKEIGDEQLAGYLLKIAKNSDLKNHFSELKDMRNEKNETYSFLGTTENFNHVRSLYLNGHVHLYLGSHFDKELFSEIIKDISKSHLKVSTYYISNALETRWIMDQENPAAGMLMMVASLGSADRGSAYAAKNEIEAKLTELEQAVSASENTDNKRKALEDKLTEVSGLISQYSMKASFYEFAITNWQKLTAEIEKIPFKKSAAFLSTTLETFYLLGLNNRNQYNLLGHESLNLPEGGRFEWNYASLPVVDFKDNMPEALTKRTQEVTENMQKYAAHLTALTEKIRLQ